MKTAITLNWRYSQFGTFLTKKCLDHSGSPIPWYTYPAIEYLRQLDFSACSVFEFGSGYSTLFWANRARTVTSVESDPHWYEVISKQVPGNARIILESQPSLYIDTIIGERYDLIVIDGIENLRQDCAKKAVTAILPGGMVILDNSDWHPQTCKVLRDADLIEVDFHGFGPSVGHCWTTSVFLHRAFKLVAEDRQPDPAIGGVHLDCDISVS